MKMVLKSCSLLQPSFPVPTFNHHKNVLPPFSSIDARRSLGIVKGSYSSLPTTLYRVLCSGFCGWGQTATHAVSWWYTFFAACDCNGRSQECYFDPELYRSTGHGGHCTGCLDNTDGAHCERCRDSFYRLGSEEGCLPCSCNPVGK